MKYKEIDYVLLKFLDLDDKKWLKIEYIKNW